MYWIQVNENVGLVRRELGQQTGITLIEDAGFVVLTGEEDTLINFAAESLLTISDEGEGKPVLRAT